MVVSHNHSPAMCSSGSTSYTIRYGGFLPQTDVECGAGHAPGTLSVCCTGHHVLAMRVCIVGLVVHLVLLPAALVI